jgi:hypothetical protein
MPKDKNQVSEAALNLSESVREASQAVADTVVTAQERNMKFGQGVFDNSVEVLKSHAEGSRSLMQELFGQSEKGQGIMHTLADSAVAAQERNMKLFQSNLQSGSELLKNHIESSRSLIQTLVEQVQRQQEAFQALARENMDTNMNFFFAPFSYFQQALETIESIAVQGMESAQKITRQGVEAAEKAAHQERQAFKAAAK